MAVIEVPMISGFRADVESLERVMVTANNTCKLYSNGLDLCCLLLALFVLAHKLPDRQHKQPGKCPN